MAKKKANKKTNAPKIIPIAEVPDYIAEMTDGHIIREIKTVRNWIYRGDLESIKVAGKVWVRTCSIDLYLSVFTEEM